MSWKVRSILGGGAALLLLGFAASGGRNLRYMLPQPVAFPAARLSPSAPAQPNPSSAVQSGPSAPRQPATSQASPSQASPAQPPPPQPTPQVQLASMGPARVLELPERTHLKIILSRSLSTDHDQTGDPWAGVLAAEVRRKGMVAWPKGTPVQGIILQSAPGDLLHGGGGLELRIRSVGGADLEAGTFVLEGRSLSAGTADQVVRIPAGQALAFALSAPKELILRP